MHLCIQTKICTDMCFAIIFIIDRYILSQQSKESDNRFETEKSCLKISETFSHILFFIFLFLFQLSNLMNKCKFVLLILVCSKYIYFHLYSINEYYCLMVDHYMRKCMHKCAIVFTLWMMLIIFWMLIIAFKQ